VLDEPTAHLDADSARELTADLLTATAGRTVLLITHDLNGLEAVDEIVVLEHGQVAERGTHEQLARAGGAYQRMIRLSRPPAAQPAGAPGLPEDGARDLRPEELAGGLAVGAPPPAGPQDRRDGDAAEF
jgi:ATP-binding cassette subfamily C protein CydCD